MYLIDSGAEDILYLYNSMSYSGRKKLAGCQSAFLLRGLPSDRRYQQFYPGARDDIDDVCRFLNSLREAGLSFRAVLASDDLLATAAIKYARRIGLDIPKDLSVVGYNNSLLAICCQPELTSVDNRLECISRQLVRTLIHTLNGDGMPQKCIFSGELIKRGTTLP